LGKTFNFDGRFRYLLSGKLGTRRGCVNIRREEKQIYDQRKKLNKYQ
jgi:hypothetical protein